MASYLASHPWFFAKLIGFPLLWYGIGRLNKEDIRMNCYRRGYQLSQRFKNYPYWDKYAEPFCVSQFTNVFTAGHAFIEGMVSDNEDQTSIQKDLDKMKQDITNELNEH